MGVTAGEQAEAIAVALRWQPWPEAAWTRASVMARAITAHLAASGFDDVTAEPPYRVGRIGVVVVTSGMDGVEPVLAILAKRAAHLDGQVLACTRGAHVGAPLVVGGKPLVVAHLRGAKT